MFDALGRKWSKKKTPAHISPYGRPLDLSQMYCIISTKCSVTGHSTHRTEHLVKVVTGHRCDWTVGRLNIFVVKKSKFSPPESQFHDFERHFHNFSSRQIHSTLNSELNNSIIYCTHMCSLPWGTGTFISRLGIQEDEALENATEKLLVWDCRIDDNLVQ
jgi:hypothetical protein